MKKHSAGLIIYRFKNGQPEVLIAHMGSPWWAKKDAGAWSIPKGEYTENEDPLATAKREFREELGHGVPAGEPKELGNIEQKNNKTVVAWAVEGDLDATTTSSNTFSVEWPPRSGKVQEFPEIDRTAWFTLPEAAKKLIPQQVPFLERLAELLEVPLEANSEPSQEKSSQESLF